MDIKKTNMKISDKFQLSPINLSEVTEGKKQIGTTPKFRTMYFDFEEGKGLPNHTHNGYASIFVHKGKVNMEFVSGEKFELDEGGYLAFDARIQHNVIAQVQSKVLVTISEPLSQD